MKNTRAVKFSIIDESDDGVYRALRRFVLKLSWDNSDPNNIMMDVDELFAELCEEVAKGLKKYAHLPYEQKLAVIRRMCDNRISELKYKYYRTHRKEHNNDISYESELFSSEEGVSSEDDFLRFGDGNRLAYVESVSSNIGNPEELAESADRVRQCRNMLSDGAKRVFDCIIGDNALLREILLTHIVRSQALGRKPKIAPWMVADTLDLSEKEVSLHFREIKNAWSVCNE